MFRVGNVTDCIRKQLFKQKALYTNIYVSGLSVEKVHSM